MIDRPIQRITSRYGKRKGFERFHKGVDLRCVTDDFTKKLPVILPEICIFDRKTYQTKWGWTFVFLPTESGYYEIKFMHMAENNRFIHGMVYEAGKEVGYNTVTNYMIKKKYGLHLHFETLPQDGKWGDPVEYFDKLGIRYT